MARVRIGSRGSQLAVWQAEHVAARLRERGHEVAIEIIKTSGDQLPEAAFTQVGVKGMFIKEIEEALAERRIDLAVHSLKDVPTEMPPGFVLAAILKREDARDAFVSREYRDLSELPKGAPVGTSSLRRQAQLRSQRPDLELIAMRGNVDTRLNKLAAGECSAIILAAAGLERLGRAAEIRSIFTVEVMCPAPGQGALAVETREGDEQTAGLVLFLNDKDARATTECERALLRALGGGCQVPIGAYAARRKDGSIHLDAVVASPDGREVLRESHTGHDPGQLGAQAGKSLLQRGAQKILDKLYGLQAVSPEQP